MNHIQNYFKTIDYAPNIAEDTSWTGKAEKAAQVCLSPARWLCGTAKYRIFHNNDTYTVKMGYHPAKGGAYVAQKVLGFFLSIPGLLFAIPFTAAAYCSPEIRLKRQLSNKPLTDDQQKQLKEMIEKRTQLAKERDGCEPVTCLLCCIVCILCCILCK